MSGKANKTILMSVYPVSSIVKTMYSGHPWDTVRAVSGEER